MKHLFKTFVFVLFFVSYQSKAQHTITGVVYNTETKLPIESANVYISNSTKGTVSKNNGAFQLNGVPNGQSELIISCLGFNTQTILINNSKTYLEVLLTPKFEELQTVVVETYDKNGWRKWGKLFTEQFIGTSQNAYQCKLINKDAIKFHYSKKRNLLRASADEPLVIENKALGYILKYDLVNFEYDFENKVFLIQGSPLFQEMTSKRNSDESKWNKNRNIAYFGSMMHFMRSLYKNQMGNDKFEIRRITGEPNKINFLINTLVPRDSLVYKVDSVSFGLFFKDRLQVIYPLAETPSSYIKSRYPLEFMSTPQTSVLRLNNGPIKIYENGAYYDGTNLMSAGFWAWSEKMANMLPLDFEPIK
jgi:hypothetical protein